MPSNAITNLTVHFKVTTTWLSSNGIANQDVSLYPWSGSAWDAVSTTILGSDDTFVYFSANPSTLG